MPNLTMVDMLSRSAPMAKKNWVKKAVGDNKGVFKAKAERAGMTTREYAEKEKDAPGTLGKEARLASTLMSMGKRRKSPLYDRNKD